MFTNYACQRGIAKGTQRRLRIAITSTLALFSFSPYVYI